MKRMRMIVALLLCVVLNGQAMAQGAINVASKDGVPADPPSEAVAEKIEQGAQAESALGAGESLKYSATQQIKMLLAREAAKTGDAWQEVLYKQEPQDVRADQRTGLVTFSIPAWDPGVDGLEGEEETWLAQIWRNLHAGKVKGSIAFQLGEEASFELTGNAYEFTKDVAGAASYAKKQFDLPRVRQAITARLLPEKLYDEDGAPTRAFAQLIRAYEGKFTQAQLEVALSAQKNASMDVSKGPQALRLVYYSGDGRKLAASSLKRAQEMLNGVDLANGLSEEEIALCYAHAFYEEAASFRNSGAKGTKQFINFDLARLVTEGLYQREFAEYVTEITAQFDKNLPDLVEKVHALADYPLREQPDSGVLAGGADEEAGTLLILQAADDGLGRYIVWKDEAGEVALTAFLRAGENCRAYIMPGKYTILCAKGVDWYGTVRMFEAEGEYVAIDTPVEVLDNTHYHTVTFGGEESEGMREAQRDEFA